MRHLWCQRSRQTGWNPPDDWWTPSVETLCAAAVERTDMEDGCVRFGRARARSGVSIGATLDDFAALSDVVGWPEPPRRLVNAVARGWVEAGHPQDGCRDPLTGLCTAAYLSTRLGEVYQAADPNAPYATNHQLLVLALDSLTNPWRHTARLIVLGYELRRFFSGGETIALLGRGRIGVLAPARDDLAERAHDLRFGICARHGAHASTVTLPETYEETLTFLDDIGEPRTSS
ncbi:hypothetical protein EFW17_07790 [Halostreptopolyspora alba]|uniref:Uncharacterized protein n=1 Tax=Halostreptopolyspora alba TaxID=2487137 RepID=A0A3N0EDI2_9ACTN|nr:hypothetical protein EFW17_07790 [Nocardiopsaceae bacterium YIM 96095]